MWYGVQGFVYGHVLVSAGGHRGRRCQIPSGAKIKGSCETQKMGAGTEPGSSAKVVHDLNH